MVYQCASAASATNSNTCSGFIYLYTASSGGASGLFIAQPSVGGAQSKSTCQDQCVLVGMVIKEGAGVPPSPPPMATSPLSFSTTGTQGLNGASLQDLSWISRTEGWAMASQPCVTGLCVRLEHTTDGGAHWQPLPDPPALVQGGPVNFSQSSLRKPCTFREFKNRVPVWAWTINDHRWRSYLASAARPECGDVEGIEWQGVPNRLQPDGVSRSVRANLARVRAWFHLLEDTDKPAHQPGPQRHSADRQLWFSHTRCPIWQLRGTGIGAGCCLPLNRQRCFMAAYERSMFWSWP